MTIHDIWGTIKIDNRFEQIVNTQEFRKLKDKTQLGFNQSATAIHTRYLHSLGVYHISNVLVDTFKEKFSDVIDISKADEDAVFLFAMLHDLGHCAFSHAAERCLNGNHEERLAKRLVDENQELHQVIINVFGEDVFKKLMFLVNKLYQNEGDKENKLEGENIFLSLISKLLSGNIDVDRIDFIFRDSKNVTGETNDFLKIFSGINLELVDNELEIVYDEELLYTIIEFLNKRFELYDTVYLYSGSRILEKLLKHFIDAVNYPFNWDTSELEMKFCFSKCLDSENDVVRRYAQVLHNKSLDGIIISLGNDSNSYELLKNRLLSSVPELATYTECMIYDYAKVRIYNSDNPIYIKHVGKIKELSTCSPMFNPDLAKEKYLLGIDIVLLETLMKRDGRNEEEIKKAIKKIKKITSSEIEYEKKYLFKEGNPIDNFKAISEALNLEKARCVENNDTYYDDDNNTLQGMRINLRKRVVDGKEEYTLKRPKSKTSIDVRDEINFDTLDDALEYLQNVWHIPITFIKEIIALKTLRVEYSINFGGGTYELTFDKTTPSFNGENYIPSYMIECELKSGSTRGLYFINQIIKSNASVEECNLSKKEIGLSIIESGLKSENVLSRKKEE